MTLNLLQASKSHLPPKANLSPHTPKFSLRYHKASSNRAYLKLVSLKVSKIRLTNIKRVRVT
jgi:hypothetical protein